MALIHMENGVQFFIQSDLDDKDAGCGSFSFRGTEGMLECSETGCMLFNGQTGGWKEMDLGVEGPIDVIGGKANGRQVKELLAWIEGGPEHRGAGYKARDTVELMMALSESARQHQVVRLPLTEKGYPLELMVAEGKLPVQKSGRYDIRGYLQREGVDEERYKQLRAEGMGHHAIMRQLHEER